MAQRRKMTRRRFLEASAAGAAGVGFPYFVPSRVFARAGQPGANERIVIGHIGVGGRGSGHVRDSGRRGDPVAVVCDVDDRRAALAVRGLKQAGQNPITCRDYRQVLDRKDVDAVMIATPDHWHAIMMVDACKAEKDVYSEKPTCRTIQEGQAMINAANKYQRVVQIGAQGRSNPAGRAAAQFARNGQLGKIDRVEVWHMRNPSYGGMSESQDPPPALDWDLWLGPARWRPYNRGIHPGAFRWFMDLGAGSIRDRGNHVLSCVYYAMNADATGPVSVEATGEPAKQGIWDVPITMEVKWEFKNPDWTMTWGQPGRTRPFPDTGRMVDWGAQLFGDKDSLIIWHGDAVNTEKKALNYQPPADGVTLPLPAAPTTPGQDATGAHRQNWFDCMKTRQKTIMPPEAGVAVIDLPIIANIAYLLGRKLQWDAKSRRFVGDDEANRFLADPYRYPWHV